MLVSFSEFGRLEVTAEIAKQRYDDWKKSLPSVSPELGGDLLAHKYFRQEYQIVLDWLSNQGA